MNIEKHKGIFTSIKKALDTNAPTLATFGSILGVAATVYFMHKASKNAADAERLYEDSIDEIEMDVTMSAEEAKEEKGHAKLSYMLRLVYIYRFALLSGIGSAGFAVLSNYLNGRTIAMMGTLLAANADKLQKLGEKAKEMVGEEKFKELQENVEKEIFGEKFRNHEIKTEKAKLKKNDDIPWDDECHFCVPWSTEEYLIPYELVDRAIKEASDMFKTNKEGQVIDRLAYLDYNGWRNKLRLPSAPAWDGIAWNADHPFRAHIGTVDFGDAGYTNAILFDIYPEKTSFKH